MKNLIAKLFVVFALLVNFNTWAGETIKSDSKHNMLMYIQPLEYTNPINLWHPYRNYWFYQGPVVEGLAMPRLSQAFGTVSVCEGNQSGQVLVWLQPRMFYNPQVQIFYGKVTANVYTGMGKFVAAYVGESKLHGFLDIKADSWIEKSYAIAIDHMVAKMQADNALQTLISQTSSTDNADATPCSMVTLLPNPKIKALSF